MSETFSILIDSRSRFETGQPGGEWLSMPTTTEQLHAAMKSVGITAENPQDFFINGFSNTEQYPFDVPLSVIQESTIDELNYLGKLLEMQGDEDRNKFTAAVTLALVYEHGTREQPAEQHFNGYPDPQLGKFEYFEVQPKDPEALQSLLREEKHSRDKLTPGDLKEHIAALHEGMIEHEARRIVADMKKLSAPNSPDKSHFMVELSPSFERLASTKDTERLFSMLPYKTLAFSQIKNSYGTYALIGKDENRDKEVRKPRPSVRAQLAQDKKRTVPKKAAAKKKDHGLEV